MVYVIPLFVDLASLLDDVNHHQLNRRSGRLRMSRIHRKEGNIMSRYTLEGLDCANCAAKIEEALRKIDGLEIVSINFTTKSIEIPKELKDKAQTAIIQVEPEVRLQEEGLTTRYMLEGLDCAACAGKIETQLREDLGIESLTINFATRSVELPSERIEEAQKIISRIEPAVVLQKKGQTHRKRMLMMNELILILSGILFLAGLIFNESLHNTPYSWAEYAILLPAYLLTGCSVIVKAIKKILRGQLFDESFLMTVATVGAIAIHQLTEAAGVMLFYAIGITFQERALNRSRRSIQALLDIQPDTANLKENGSTRKVRPESVSVGQIILIRPGEKVPLDGVILEGTSFVDTAALTGESTPQRVGPGEQVLAGMINQNGVLTVKVEKPFGESSIARILQLVEKAGERKAPMEQFITRFAHYYTPVVVFAAVAVAVIPPMLFSEATLTTWLHRALVLLVISCPCALMVSIPLGYFGGIGGASRRGILVKGANFLDALSNMHTVVFDKTGTLTQGVFRVTKVNPKNGFTSEQLMAAAAHAEIHSNHPIAKSIREAWDGTVDEGLIENYHEIPAHGISAIVNGQRVLAGNDRLMHQEAVEHEDCNLEGTSVYVAINDQYAGYILISDEVKADAVEAIQSMRSLGVERIEMLTGDEESVARRVAEQLGLDGFSAGLLPEDKVARVEALIASIPNPKKQKLAFVGDGVNDAPVITRADLGVAMGGLGTDAAIEAADLVLMEDHPLKLAEAVRIARHTRKIVRQNIVMALAVKGFFIILGTAGVASIWEAVFADVGVTLLAVFNAMRTIRMDKKISV